MTDEKPKRERGKKQKEPPAPNPWAIPDFAEKGDEDNTTTYASVGRALSAWEDFESQFARVYAHLVGGMAPGPPAERAYGAVRTFEGRAQMVAAASDAYFDLYQFGSPHGEKAKTFHAEIQSLINLARNHGSARRNEIAHGMVASYQFFMAPSYLGKFEELPKGYVLGPPNYMTQKRELETIPIQTVAGERLPSIWMKTTRPNYLYNAAQIAHFADLFKTILYPVAHNIVSRLQKPPPWT